ncbi:uncharacterized protein LOC128214722 [Mya arenaria]|uniref:uncharacterized protein LOC128214722 n=1 Tax=Mya arenaria TaxID=6604 RepID=UPI0022E0B330|nr:uncharacterized protein LOC128214722 [Mya arenaria]
MQSDPTIMKAAVGDTTLTQDNKVSNQDNTSDALFEKLYHYDFHENKKFMDGWRKVKEAIPPQKMKESFIKAQVFFFSRELEPVDYQKYCKWLEDNERNVEETASYKTCMEENTSLADVTKPKTNDTSSNKEDIEGEVMEPKHPENFLELVEMIQKGIKLPGTEELDIQPLNVEPTPSDKLPPAKPWEVDLQT